MCWRFSTLKKNKRLAPGNRFNPVPPKGRPNSQGKQKAQIFTNVSPDMLCFSHQPKCTQQTPLPYFRHIINISGEGCPDPVYEAAKQLVCLLPPLFTAALTKPCLMQHLLSRSDVLLLAVPAYGVRHAGTSHFYSRIRTCVIY